jgi:hypothetical protein
MAYFSNRCSITHEEQNSYLEICMNAKLNPKKLVALNLKNKQIMKTNHATNRPQKYTPKYTESVTIRTV